MAASKKDRASFLYWHARQTANSRLPKRKQSNRVLRTFLIAKARVGRFDPRYYTLYGFKAQTDRRLRAATTRAFAAGLIVTSTNGGKHATTSLHYQDRAVDFGLRSDEVGTAKGAAKMVRFQRSEYRRGGQTELIGPDNRQIILRGRSATLAEGTALEQAHDNHVHEGF